MSRKNTVYYKLASKICEKANMPDDTKYVAYFLDMVAFQIYEMLFILGIGLLFGILPETIWVMLGFFIGRSGNKGYHARNMKLCVLYSTVSIIGLAIMGSMFGYIICVILGMAFGIALRKTE